MFANYLNFAGINLEQEAEPEEPDTTDTEVEEETTGTEEGLAEGKYTIEATALKENNDELSMSDQFLTEKATLTVTGGTITASMTWHGTEYITMDMLKELKYQKSDGSFVETPRTLSADNSAVTLTFPVADINKATIFQVYVPEGMGEMRPKFRLVFDTKTLSKAASSPADKRHHPNNRHRNNQPLLMKTRSAIGQERAFTPCREQGSSREMPTTISTPGVPLPGLRLL